MKELRSAMCLHIALPQLFHIHLKINYKFVMKNLRIGSEKKQRWVHATKIKSLYQRDILFSLILKS
jgi:hypothetical protein